MHGRWYAVEASQGSRSHHLWRRNLLPIHQRENCHHKVQNWMGSSHFSNSGDRKPMLTLWKFLLLSEHDYCYQLWNPHHTGEVQSLEVLQHFFVKKISGVSHLSYWDQLSKMKMYCLERRRERYIAIYTWKILEGTVLNIGSDNNAITATWHARRGR